MLRFRSLPVHVWQNPHYAALPPSFPHRTAIKTETIHFQSVPWSLGLTSKGEPLAAGSTYTATICSERCSVSRFLFYLLLWVTGNSNPTSSFPHRWTYAVRYYFPKLYFIYLWDSKETGVLIIIKSLPPLNVSGKNIPPSYYSLQHNPNWRDKPLSRTPCSIYIYRQKLRASL